MADAQSKARKSPQSQFFYKGLGAQVGASLMTLLVYSLALSVFGVDTESSVYGGLLASGLLGMVLLCMMIYSIGWGVGNRDQNLVRYGHIPYAPRRALYGHAVSQIPGLLVVLLAIAESIHIVSIPWAVMAARVLYFPFAWFFDATGPHTFFLTYLIPFVVLPPFCHWGYYNGYRFISLWRKIVYKNQEDASKNRAKDKRLR